MQTAALGVAMFLRSMIALLAVVAPVAAGAQSTFEEKLAYTRALIAQCQVAADAVVASSQQPGANFASARAALEDILARGCMSQEMYDAAHTAVSRNEVRALASAGEAEKALGVLASDKYLLRAPDRERLVREVRLMQQAARGSTLLASADTRVVVLSTVVCAWKTLRAEAVSEAKTERRYAEELGGAPSSEKIQRLQAQARDADEGSASALTSIRDIGSTPLECKRPDVERRLYCWARDRKHLPTEDCAEFIEAGVIDAMHQAAPALSRYK